MGRLLSRFSRLAAGFFGLAVMAFIVSGMAAGCAHRADKSYIMEKSREANRRGEEAFASGEGEQALERFREALRIDRSIENRGGEMIDLINLGRVYISLGRYGTAIDFLNEAVRLGVQTRDDANLSDAHAAFARAEYLSGQTGTALDHIEESLQIDDRLGRRSGSKLNLKGLIYIDSGRHAEAADIIKEAMEINRAQNDAVETANSYRALADLSSSRGMFADALAFYESAYAIDLHTGDSRKVAWGLTRMAETHLALGKRSKAALLFERSYVVSFNSGHTQNAFNVLDKVIGVYRDLGDAEKAVFYQRVKDGLGSRNRLIAR